MKEIHKYSETHDFTPGGKVKYSHKVQSAPEEEIKALLLSQMRRAVTNLFKSQLTQLEDIQQEHKHSIKKVDDLVSEDFIRMIDFLDDEKLGYYRKKTLDKGNETIRDLERLLENFEISLKK
tara:strand:+ start:5848 stop:6213 length:366 start_codon:yes stop_codon:yes gene_type:complete